MTTSMKDTTANNGVNVEALLSARETLTGSPEAAKFQWQASSKWIDGTHCQSTIQKFYGLGGQQQHLNEFTFDSDHPEVFASQDKGPTPVEYLLVGLAGCLTAGIAAVAQNRNIQLNSVTANVEADMDIQGILGIDSDVRNGFSKVNVSYSIDANANREEIEAIVAQSQKRSAVYDALTNPTFVNIEVA